MSEKANPYGRIMSLMGGAGKAAADTGAGFLIGEMITGAQIKVGDLTLARDDYVLLTHEIKVNDKKFKIPYKSTQSITIEHYHGETITISVPPLKKGDKVLCYQINDEEFVVFGKVE